MRKILKNRKAIFFDAGGTLLYPFPSVGEIYRDAALRHGCVADALLLEKKFHEVWLKRDGLTSLVAQTSEKVEREWWRSVVKEVFSEIAGLTNFDPFFAELYDLFAHPSVWRLYPETLEVLDELKHRKIRLGIISNWDSRLLLLCQGLALDRYFDLVLASAVFGASKPSPRIFQEGLRHFQVSPEEALHVGDSLEDDIHGARGVGMGAILVDRRGVHRKGPLDIEIIQDLKGLIQFF